MNVDLQFLNLELFNSEKKGERSKEKRKIQEIIWNFFCIEVRDNQSKANQLSQ
jgi:hypothetical protein